MEAFQDGKGEKGEATKKYEEIAQKGRELLTINFNQYVDVRASLEEAGDQKKKSRSEELLA